MKRIFLAPVLFLIILVLAGCGSGGNAPPQFVAQILSDPAFDGDIAQDPVSGAFTVTQGNTQSVFAGVNPVTGAEFRAFLDFPLTGSGGVPGNAVIVSAVLDFVVVGILPNPLAGSIPVRIDLVSFQPPNLVGTDFSRTVQPALATITITPPISQNDFGRHVAVDVTPLMNTAQRLGLPDFQVRISGDLGALSPGLMEINDTTGANRGVLAPLLRVTYM